MTLAEQAQALSAALDRFYAKVVVEATIRYPELSSPCHWWIGARSQGGKHTSSRAHGGKNKRGLLYPHFWFEGAVHRAHRWLWEKMKGPVPDGWEVDHLCNNSLCVNLAHLEPKPGPDNATKANTRRKAA